MSLCCPGMLQYSNGGTEGSVQGNSGCLYSDCRPRDLALGKHMKRMDLAKHWHEGKETHLVIVKMAL